MAVTSKPLTARRRRPVIVVRRTLRRWRSPADWIGTFMRRVSLTWACLLGLGISGYLWFFGAGWTVSGSPLLANVLLAHISSVGRIEPALAVALPLAASVFAALWILPVCFSMTEVFGVPLQKAGERWIWLGLGLALVWLLVISADLASTFLGVYNPNEVPGTLGWLTRGTLPGAAVTTTFFTFFPEWLAGAMLVALRRVWGGGYGRAGANHADTASRDRDVDPADAGAGGDVEDRDTARE